MIWVGRAGVVIAGGLLLAGCSSGTAPSTSSHPSGHFPCPKRNGCVPVISTIKFTLSPNGGRPGTLVTLVANGCKDPSGDSHTFGYNAVGDLQLDTMEQQQLYPNTSWAIPGRLVGQTMRATFRIPTAAPRPIGSFSAQCADSVVFAKFRVVESPRTVLGVVVRSDRVPGGFRLVVAPARFSEGQYLRIADRATLTFMVPSSLVADPSLLVGAVEVTTRGSTVTNLAIMGG